MNPLPPGNRACGGRRRPTTKWNRFAPPSDFRPRFQPESCNNLDREDVNGSDGPDGPPSRDSDLRPRSPAGGAGPARCPRGRNDDLAEINYALKYCKQLRRHKLSKNVYSRTDEGNMYFEPLCICMGQDSQPFERSSQRRRR